MNSLKTIDSIKDPWVVRARELTSSKGRLEHDAFLLEGQEHIQWAVDSKLIIEVVFVHDKISEHALFKKFEQLHIPYFLVSEGILKKITDTNYMVPLVAIAKNPVSKNSTQAEFVVVLDNLIDHGNIGTIVRSAAAFGIKNIVTTSESSDFFYKKMIDASRGKVFEISIKKCTTAQDTINYLKQQGYQIITTSPHARQLQSLTRLSEKPVALVLGNETDGCAQLLIDQADVVVQIPMSSDVESLNVAVAAGISMYELKIKLVIAMLIQKIYKNLGRQFGVTLQLIQQAFNRQLATVTDLSAMQVIVLMILKCDQWMSLGQVIQDTGEHGHELQNFLQPLFERGYIESVSQDEVSGLVLTKQGEEFIAKLWPIVEKSEDTILENFSAVEKAQLTEYIARIQANCSKIISAK